MIFIHGFALQRRHAITLVPSDLLLIRKYDDIVIMERRDVNIQSQPVK